MGWEGLVAVKRDQIWGTSKWLDAVSGTEAGSKVEGVQVLGQSHKENGDTIKRNGEAKKRHFPGQASGVCFGHGEAGLRKDNWIEFFIGQVDRSRDPRTEITVRKWICKWLILSCRFEVWTQRRKVTQGQGMNVRGPGMTYGWCWVRTDPKVCPKSRSPY